MIDFFEFNNNPKGKKTGDCVIRALAQATGKPYLEVYKELFEISCKKGYMINDRRCYEKFLEQNGFVKYKQPKKWDGTKYTIGEIDELVGEDDIVIVKCAGHLTCVYDLYLYDTWDCRDYCIGNFYIKEED